MRRHGLSTHGASGGGNAGREICGLHPSILARKVPSQILCVPSSSRPRTMFRGRAKQHVRQHPPIQGLLDPSPIFLPPPRLTSFGICVAPAAPLLSATFS